MESQTTYWWWDLVGSPLVSEADPIEVLANIERLTMDSLQTELRILKAD